MQCTVHRSTSKLSGLLLALVFILMGNVGWGQVISENFQSWTSHSSYGDYTQTGSGGTWTLTQSIVAPTGAANGTGSAGLVQLKSAAGILTLPSVSSGGIGTITIQARVSSSNGGFSIEKSVGGGTWSTVQSFTSSSTTAIQFQATVNDASANIQLRINNTGGTGGRALYVHDCVVTAPTTYAITSSAGSNGSISPNGTTNVISGGSQAYTITPTTGYHIANVLVDGVSNSGAISSGSYTFSNVTATHTISATFAINTYNIVASAGSNGSISPSGTTAVSYNGSQAYTITPNSGYHVADVLVDGSSVGAVTGYTFSNVTATHTISASFAITVATTDFRTKASGNFSDPATWEYFDGSGYSNTTSSIPVSTNNISVLNALTLDQDFTVGSGKTFTLSAPLTIAATKTLSVTGSADFGNQSVTVQSNSNGTGAIGSSTTISNATNVTVERYIPNNGTREWRLLSVPTSTTQSINTAWQNGQASGVEGPAGKGTWITSKETTAITNGYDARTASNSMLAYSVASNAWVGVTTSTATTGIATDAGYLIYIRGDRTAKSSNSIITPTTLSTTGGLKQGDQFVSITDINTATGGTYQLVGNPYASAIDLTKISLSSSSYAISVWDPKLGNGAGGFQTLTVNGGNFTINPGGGSYGASGSTMNTVESGAAFFVQALSTTGSLTFKETSKVNASAGNNGTFRNNAPARAVTYKKVLQTNLYNGQDSIAKLVDGTRQYFDISFSNALDDLDARKLGNFGENFGISVGGQLVAVEKRTINAADTIFYNMSGLQQKPYRLEFTATKVKSPGMKAFLEDSYTGTRTAVNLNGITSYNFTVDANAGSSAANRFRIVFTNPNAAAIVSTASYVSADTKHGVSVYPNPVTNGSAQLSLNNQKAGVYTAILYNAKGEQVLTKTINHAGGSSVATINFAKNIVAGTYSLTVIGVDKQIISKQTIIIAR